MYWGGGGEGRGSKKGEGHCRIVRVSVLLTFMLPKELGQDIQQNLTGVFVEGEGVGSGSRRREGRQ